MTIGSRILNYMKERGVTQAFLSRRTGISYAVVRDTLHGKRKLGADEFELFCEALEATPDTFICKRDQ